MSSPAYRRDRRHRATIAFPFDPRIHGDNARHPTTRRRPGWRSSAPARSAWRWRCTPRALPGVAITLFDARPPTRTSPAIRARSRFRSAACRCSSGCAPGARARRSRSPGARLAAAALAVDAVRRARVTSAPTSWRAHARRRDELRRDGRAAAGGLARRLRHARGAPRHARGRPARRFGAAVGRANDGDGVSTPRPASPSASTSPSSPKAASSPRSRARPSRTTTGRPRGSASPRSHAPRRAWRRSASRATARRPCCPCRRCPADPRPRAPRSSGASTATTTRCAAHRRATPRRAQHAPSRRRAGRGLPAEVFPLGLIAEPTLTDGRTVRIGNAAQTLHPGRRPGPQPRHARRLRAGALAWPGAQASDGASTRALRKLEWRARPIAGR